MENELTLEGINVASREPPIVYHRFIDTQIRVVDTTLMKKESDIYYEKYSKRVAKKARKAKQIARQRYRKNRSFRKNFYLPHELWQIILEYVCQISDRFPVFRAISKNSETMIDNYLVKSTMNDEQLMRILPQCVGCGLYGLIDGQRMCVSGCLCHCDNNECSRFHVVITSRIFPQSMYCGKCRKYTLEPSSYKQNKFLLSISIVTVFNNEQSKYRNFMSSDDDLYYNLHGQTYADTFDLSSDDDWY